MQITITCLANCVAWNSEWMNTWNFQCNPENLGSLLKRILGRRQNPFITVLIRYQWQLAQLKMIEMASDMLKMSGRVSPFEASTCHLPRLRVNCTKKQSMVKIIGFTGGNLLFRNQQEEKAWLLWYSVSVPREMRWGQVVPALLVFTMCPVSPSKPHIRKLMRIRDSCLVAWVSPGMCISPIRLAP